MCNPICYTDRRLDQKIEPEPEMRHFLFMVVPLEYCIENLITFGYAAAVSFKGNH